jgi:uncharacterized protein YkwD/nucleoid-associated protein YgaU
MLHMRTCWRWLGVGMFAAGVLSACTSSAIPTSTPQGNVELTRIVTILAVVPTAAPLATASMTPLPVPSTTPEPTQSAKPTDEPAQPTPAQLTPTAMPATNTYTVAPGDTLSLIAKKYGTSVAALQLANDLGESQTLRAGAKLAIPAGKLAPEESLFWFAYTVKPGDTYTDIVSRFRVSNELFVRVNKITDLNLLNVGQVLVIPAESAAAAVAIAKQAVAPDAPREATAIPVVDRSLILPTEQVVLIPLEPRTLPGNENGPVVQSPANDAVATPIPAPVAASGDVEQIRATLLALYNEQRIAAGLSPLQLSPVLQTSAQGHADDCASRGQGSHTGSDGSTSRIRIQRAGFAGRFTGENWAWSRTAEKAFDMWFFQETPTGPHRANIMSANYGQVGFGVAPSRGGYFIIANLGG